MQSSDKCIVGIGNALVDVVSSVEPETIQRHGLTPAAMHLIESEAADRLYSEITPQTSQSGGSVANSIAHIGATGRASAFIGKIADDPLGGVFAEDMKLAGATTPAPKLKNGVGTGRCVVLVTPDGERTMSTYLGAARELKPEDVEAAMPDDPGIVLIEGYLWDSPDGDAVIRTAADLARDAGAQVALTPSDAQCVERNHDSMSLFVKSDCDILIGNEAEVSALSGAARVDDSLAWARGHVGIAAVTMSERGSLVCDEEFTAHIGVRAVDAVVDATGAGDAYAAGFLNAIASGANVSEAGMCGARMASGVITHFGARRAIQTA